MNTISERVWLVVDKVFTFFIKGTIIWLLMIPIGLMIWRNFAPHYNYHIQEVWMEVQTPSGEKLYLKEGDVLEMEEIGRYSYKTISFCVEAFVYEVGSYSLYEAERLGKDYSETRIWQYYYNQKLNQLLVPQANCG